MELFAQQILNGLTIGAFYALIALGYTMVYGILKQINFAHGDLFMFGAYLGMTFLNMLIGAGLVSPWLIIPVCLASMLLVSALGLLLERAAYRPLRNAGRLPPIVSTLGAAIILQNAVMLLYEPRFRWYPEKISLPAWSLKIYSIQITFTQLLLLFLSFTFMTFLYLFIMKTKWGIAMRAVSLDINTAKLMGINVNKAIEITFIIGPALGAAGGIMVGLYYRQLIFTMGWNYGLKAFTAAILGGIGNVPGAVLGGIVLGLLESLSAGYIASCWKDAIAFFVLIIILLIRPQGILGEKIAEKI
ncbi:MAG: branched-chain amino acid ABC transporter permease [Candidatus Coatesbacteria bacterium]|nr:branched-chain amino acid ABC transporter permease [Candidatus Coatesbacteria bacterium]